MSEASSYQHAHWEFKRRLLRFLLRWIGFTILVKLDGVEGLENFPAQGPAILLINHIAFIDPMVVMNVSPRNIVPMAKVEVYDYPLVGIFPRLWGVIPVRRGAVDRRALKNAIQVLKAGEIILVAPEGTRSPQLQQAKEGFAYLASKTGAPIVPVTLEGTEGYPSFPLAARWKGPGATVRFGQPFRFREEFRRPKREQLEQMTTEAMYILSTMLPEHRRGVYADLSKGSLNTIEWVSPAE